MIERYGHIIRSAEFTRLLSVHFWSSKLNFRVLSAHWKSIKHWSETKISRSLFAELGLIIRKASGMTNSGLIFCMKIIWQTSMTKCTLLVISWNVQCFIFFFMEELKVMKKIRYDYFNIRAMWNSFFHSITHIYYRIMRDVGKNLEIPLFVFGPETHMTAIVGMALEKREVPVTAPAASSTANFLLPGSVSLVYIITI